MLNDALLLELVLPAVDAPELVRSRALGSRRWAELARDEGLWARLLARDAPYQVHPLLYRRRCAGGAQVYMHLRELSAERELQVSGGGDDGLAINTRSEMGTLEDAQAGPTQTKLLVMNHTDADIYVHWVGFDGEVVKREGGKNSTSNGHTAPPPPHHCTALRPVPDRVEPCSPETASRCAFSFSQHTPGHFMHDSFARHAFALADSAGRVFATYLIASAHATMPTPESMLGASADTLFDFTDGSAALGRDFIAFQRFHALAVTQPASDDAGGPLLLEYRAVLHPVSQVTHGRSRAHSFSTGGDSGAAHG
jgi:hypothetical protein